MCVCYKVPHYQTVSFHSCAASKLDACLPKPPYGVWRWEQVDTLSLVFALQQLNYEFDNRNDIIFSMCRSLSEAFPL